MPLGEAMTAPLDFAEFLRATDPSRTADLPAFTPGSFCRDCELLFPISPTRPPKAERERMEDSHELFRWRMRVRVVR